MIKVFDRWDTEGINVQDMGLKEYITLEPKVFPKTGARYAGNKFHKSKILILERLINRVMVPGHKAKKHFKTSSHITGKAQNASSIVEKTLEKIEKKTNQNPIFSLKRIMYPI